MSHPIDSRKEVVTWDTLGSGRAVERQALPPKSSTLIDVVAEASRPAAQPEPTTN
jgi:hypothetical protein